MISVLGIGLWQDTVIGDWINGIATDFLALIFDLIESFFTSAEILCTNSAVTNVAIYMSDLASVIITIVVVKQIISIYILETDGDSEQDPMQLLVKSAEAIALMQCSTVLFNWVLNEAHLIYDAVMTHAGAAPIFTSPSDLSDQVESVFTTVVGASASAKGIGLLILVIGIFLMLFKGVIRGVELALQKMLFPIFCCDLLTPGKERFNAFLTSFIITACCYCIQLLTFRLSIQGFLSMDSFIEMLYAYGWLYISLKAPKWIEKYAYSSGIGGLARTGASSAAQVVISSLARKAA